MTGYLTSIRPEAVKDVDVEAGETCLRIPNEEVRAIFAETVAQWFRDSCERMDRKPLIVNEPFGMRQVIADDYSGRMWRKIL